MPSDLNLNLYIAHSIVGSMMDLEGLCEIRIRVMDIRHCNLIGKFKFEPIAGSMAWTLRGCVRQDESHGPGGGGWGLQESWCGDGRTGPENGELEPRQMEQVEQDKGDLVWGSDNHRQ